MEKKNKIKIDKTSLKRLNSMLKIFQQTGIIYFFNECDLQMHLAIWLKETKKYDGIDVEYYVPKNINLEKIINGIVNYTLSLNKGKYIVLLN